MNKILKSLILTLFLLSTVFVSLAEAGSPYLRYWIICGPFENAKLDTECIRDEASFTPIPGKIIKGKRCRAYLSCEDKIVFDLEEVFGPHENAVAYAFIEVYSSTARKVKLYLGSDDSIKVWLNGENVFTNDAIRALVFDEDKIDVILKGGWNRLLIKVYNNELAWNFSARFIRRSGSGVEDLTYRPPMMYQLSVKGIEVSSTQEADPEKEETFDAKNAIDKNRWTKWSSDWSDPQWIILDLGRPKLIKKILLNWESYAKNYSIELSSDKASWKKVYSTDIGDGGQDVINLKEPVKARYIRVTGTQRGTAYGYALWELQAFSEKNND